jgi:hypothetical protein
MIMSMMPGMAWADTENIDGTGDSVNDVEQSVEQNNQGTDEQPNGQDTLGTGELEFVSDPTPATLDSAETTTTTTVQYGTVEPFGTNDGAGVSVNMADPSQVVVTVDPNVAKTWVQKDNSLGRSFDGWWYGLKITAPASIDNSKVGVQRRSYYEGNEVSWITRDWNSIKDSGTNTPEYLYFYPGLSAEAANIIIANNIALISEWHFDWDGDGTYEQDVLIKLDKNNLNLVKDGKTVYPIAEDSDFEAEIGIGYTTLSEAINDAAAYTPIKLLKDVNVSDTLNIEKDVKIDLNGHKITGIDERVFQVKSGKLTLTGTGTVTSVKPEGGKLADNNSVIRVGDNSGDDRTAGLDIGKDVTIEAPATYGVTVFGSKTTETVDIAGTINATPSAALSGNGTAVYGGTKITLDGATLTSVNDVAIYHPQDGELNIKGDTTIKGTTGVELKAGVATIEGNPTIEATVTPAGNTENNNGSSTKGYSVAVVNNSNYAGPASAKIYSGNYIGPVAVVIDNTVSGASGTISVTGGTFDTEVDASYIADGYACASQEDSVYKVSKKPKITEIESNSTVKVGDIETTVSTLDSSVQTFLTTISNNTAVTEVPPANLVEATGNPEATLKIDVDSIKISDSGAKLESVAYEVKPVDKNGKEISELIENSKVTFRLPVPSDWTFNVQVAHKHDNKTTYSFYPIRSENNNNFVEIETDGFSVFELTYLTDDTAVESGCVVKTDTHYYTLDDLQKAVNESLYAEGENIKYLTLLTNIAASKLVTVPNGKILNIKRNGYEWSATMNIKGTVLYDTRGDEERTVSAVVSANGDYTDRQAGNDTYDVYKKDTVKLEIKVNGGDFYGATVKFKLPEGLTLDTENSITKVDEYSNSQDGWTLKDGVYTFYKAQGDSEIVTTDGVIGTFILKVDADAEIGSKDIKFVIDNDTDLVITTDKKSSSSSLPAPVRSATNSSVNVLETPEHAVYVTKIDSTDNNKPDYAPAVGMVYVFTDDDVVFTFPADKKIDIYDVTNMGYTYGSTVEAGNNEDTPLTVEGGKTYKHVYAYMVKDADILGNPDSYLMVAPNNTKTTKLLEGITTVVPEDVNGSNGVVNVSDAVAVRSILSLTDVSEWEDYLTAQLFYADVNRDGAVTVADAAAIKDKIFGVDR